MASSGLCTVVAALTGLCACSGSAPLDPPPPIAVSFEPSSLEACTTAPEPAYVRTVATLDALPDAAAGVRITDLGGVLDPDRMMVTVRADGRYTVSAATVFGLTPGLHEGALGFDVCRDPPCSEVYAMKDGSVPYAIEVEPPLSLSVAIDGIPVPSSGTYRVTSGQTVTVTASVPVTWSRGSSLGGADIHPALIDDTTWTGTITGGYNWVGILASSRCSGLSEQVLFDISAASPP